MAREAIGCDKSRRLHFELIAPILHEGLDNPDLDLIGVRVLQRHPDPYPIRRVMILFPNVVHVCLMMKGGRPATPLDSTLFPA